jgi:hypothetical protein
MVWFKIPSDRDYKTHLGDVSLMAATVKSLRARGMDVRIQAGSGLVSEVWFDMGSGMVCADEPKHTIDLNGLRITFYLRDAWLLREIVERCEPRDEIGTTYYKVHGRFVCLCLTPALYDRLRSVIVAVDNEFDTAWIDSQVAIDGRLSL